MTFKDKVENHPAVFFLTTFISGIGIGFAAHTAMTVERSAALDALKTSLEVKEEHLKESLAKCQQDNIDFKKIVNESASKQYPEITPLSAVAPLKNHYEIIKNNPLYTISAETTLVTIADIIIPANTKDVYIQNGIIKDVDKIDRKNVYCVLTLQKPTSLDRIFFEKFCTFSCQYWRTQY